MNKLRLYWLILLACVLGQHSVWADDADRRSPFGVTVSSNAPNGTPAVQVQFTVPSNCVLYAERLHFLEADGTELTPTAMPKPVTLIDPHTGHEKPMYDHDFTAALAPVTGNLTVKFQGCTNGACFFPEQRVFAPQASGAYAETTLTEASDATNAVAGSAADWKSAAANFQVVARQTGYLSPKEFLAFLDQARHGGSANSGDTLAGYKNLGVLAYSLLVLLGGLGLNLTPCILPLIPINLAIIGAGRAAHSRREGFLHGGAYGLGMSLAYGVLGLVVVLTGAKFGTLNASPWFNVIIAVVFLAMSLAMFDVFHLDFNRFDRFIGGRESVMARHSRSKVLVAFSLGAVAALLAGACVAPVVISVMLMASAMHAQGSPVGLALPFLLGVGMALPWPFLGASLSFLPKPGKWMNWVKHGFGVAIVLFALYYGNLARGLFISRHAQSDLASAPGSAAPVPADDRALLAALQTARQEGRPVFVDFAASWCKNCEAMDLTVFNQPQVQQQLQNFVVVKYHAESPNVSPAREVLDHFNVLGLPTYLVLSKQ
jgi:thiol:disulfide interchange protein